MDFADEYLAKQHLPERKILTDPDKHLKYIAVIPAYNESGLTKCLDSLYNCRLPEDSIEVITVFNWPWGSGLETVTAHHKALKQATDWAQNKNSNALRFLFSIAEPLDPRRSGVGYARKTGMDEAIRRFNRAGQAEGIIISLDADTQVEQNYWHAIEDHYKRNPGIHGCNIYFEHPFESEKDPAIVEAILQYELHQRYYVQALRYAGHPNSYHTVGSAFSVKAMSYCLQGGMNMRKAGEDFYFLQKIFDLGNFSECNSTAVYPSARASDRVPFGTGKVVSDFLVEKQSLKTFHIDLFAILKEFIFSIKNSYPKVQNNDLSFITGMHPLMKNFLLKSEFQKRLLEIASNSSGEQAFLKRFFRWFNMFRMLKFLNYGKKNYPDMAVNLAARELIEIQDMNTCDWDEAGLLYYLRKKDRGREP